MPYYHTTYNEPPSKSVVHDIMLKLVTTMHEKSIPFCFLVGDMPTYKTTVQLKVEKSIMKMQVLTCWQARASKWHKMKKSTIRLPPNDDTLNCHSQMTNYITYCQIHYELLEHPSPISHGWEFMRGNAG